MDGREVPRWGCAAGLAASWYNQIDVLRRAFSDADGQNMATAMRLVEEVARAAMDAGRSFDQLSH